MNTANSPSSPAPPVGRFPIPKVSQTGDPDARHVVPVEQVAKSKKESSWSFTSIFKNPKTSKVEFRPPDSQQGSLVSFDEMLSACPIIHVRLHDSQCKYVGLLFILTQQSRTLSAFYVEH